MSSDVSIGLPVSLFSRNMWYLLLKYEMLPFIGPAVATFDLNRNDPRLGLVVLALEGSGQGWKVMLRLVRLYQLWG